MLITYWFRDNKGLIGCEMSRKMTKKRCLKNCEIEKLTMQKWFQKAFFGAIKAKYNNSYYVTVLLLVLGSHAVCA